jgi:prepilin-type processing-associated H-X9-DG protein
MDRCDGDDPVQDFYGTMLSLQLQDLVYDAFWEANMWTGDASDDLIDNDLPAVAPGAGSGGGDTHYRLKEGIERFMITDINNPAGSSVAQSELPIMCDVVAGNSTNIKDAPEVNAVQLFNHVPGGANVLYMDGHVSFVRYGPDGKFPANPSVAHLFGG